MNHLEGVKKETLKPLVDVYTLPNRRRIIVLSEGRLFNLGNATGHPSFVMSCSFSNQVLGQIELFTNTDSYDIGVHQLPKILDEKVAALHVNALGGHISRLSQNQSDYIDVPVEGPFKSDYYRY